VRPSRGSPHQSTAQRPSAPGPAGASCPAPRGSSSACPAAVSSAGGRRRARSCIRGAPGTAGPAAREPSAAMIPGRTAHLEAGQLLESTALMAEAVQHPAQRHVRRLLVRGTNRAACGAGWGPRNGFPAALHRDPAQAPSGRDFMSEYPPLLRGSGATRGAECSTADGARARARGAGRTCQIQAAAIRSATSHRMRGASCTRAVRGDDPGSDGAP
jgi:hypothetical protein